MKKKNSNDEKHLSRQQLLLAARDKDRILEHLKICQSCREAVELLKEYQVMDNQYLLDAPDFLIRRAIAVAEDSPTAKRSKRRAAAMIFDSWLMPQPIGVRSVQSLDHRRLRFDVDGIIFDLRAERLKAEWDFTARISGQESSASLPSLLAGNKPIIPDESGFYAWKSKRPPKKLLLNIGGTVIELPELSWKKLRTL